MGCGCEFVGSLVVNGGTTDPVYSTPIARGGNAVTCVLDVLEFETASASLAVILQHKNRSETTWAAAATFSSISGPGVATAGGSGIKQLVRWMFMIGTGATDGDLYRVQKNLVWRPY